MDDVIQILQLNRGQRKSFYWLHVAIRYTIYLTCVKSGRPRDNVGQKLGKGMVLVSAPLALRVYQACQTKQMECGLIFNRIKLCQQ